MLNIEAIKKYMPLKKQIEYFQDNKDNIIDVVNWQNENYLDNFKNFIQLANIIISGLQEEIKKHEQTHNEEFGR